MMIAVAISLAGLAGWGAYNYLQATQRDSEAQAAGFIDDADAQKAKARGVSDAATWHAKVTAENAERAKLREDAANLKAKLSINPASKMSVATLEWKVGGFGSVGLVSPTLRNDNAFEVKDIEIECTFSGKSGTRLSSKTYVIFDTVKGKSKRTFKDLNLGFIDQQSARAFCEVNSAKIALLDR
ncbi:hypothetical protein [Bradyrhizobium sp. BR 10261]|uniref:hypothetical protein n=1 Tax=Bradyrhizobium sp. BR 10261 TaxID=2749992 RepID=UPI001C6470E7|nr:hypothetical protein [Bradyrhizobium sp. BR 10261]